MVTYMGIMPLHNHLVQVQQGLVQSSSAAEHIGQDLQVVPPLIPLWALHEGKTQNKYIDSGPHVHEDCGTTYTKDSAGGIGKFQGQPIG